MTRRSENLDVRKVRLRFPHCGSFCYLHCKTLILGIIRPIFSCCVAIDALRLRFMTHALLLVISLPALQNSDFGYYPADFFMLRRH